MSKWTTGLPIGLSFPLVWRFHSRRPRLPNIGFTSTAGSSGTRRGIVPCPRPSASAGSGRVPRFGLRLPAFQDRSKILEVLLVRAPDGRGHDGGRNLRKTAWLAAVANRHSCLAISERLPGVRSLHG